MIVEINKKVSVDDLAGIKTLIYYRGGVGEVAKELGWDTATLYSVLNNQTKSLKKVLKLSKFLDVPIDEVKEWVE